MNNDHMKKAITLAKENVTSNTGGPFGAVIVKDGKVISQGTNMVTSTNDPSAHAEVVAIRRACEKLGSFSLKGCEIYTSCEPCPMCLATIYWARLDKIYFSGTQNDAARIGFDDAFLYEEFKKEKSDRSLPIIHIDHENTQDPFSAWEQNTDKIEY